MAERDEIIVFVLFDLSWSAQVHNETNISDSISDGAVLTDCAQECGDRKYCDDNYENILFFNIHIKYRKVRPSFCVMLVVGDGV